MGELNEKIQGIVNLYNVEFIQTIVSITLVNFSEKNFHRVFV
jgi:hypothetical protein